MAEMRSLSNEFFVFFRRNLSRNLRTFVVTGKKRFISTHSPESRAASPETQQQKKKARLPINELDCFDSPLSTLEKAEKQDLYPCQEPKHPSLVYFNERLVTLRDVWSAVNSLSCVNEVANAGFFYCGKHLV